MKDKVIKTVKSNVGFIIALAFLVVITLNPQAKGFVLSGLIKTGLYQPNVNNTKPEGSSVTTIKPTLFASSDGKILDLADLKGKVVFLIFWAAWCPPCIAEMPSVNSLYNKLKKNENVIFILADVDNNLKRSESFMKRNKYNLPVYIPSGPISQQLFQGNLPTTVIINKKGEIVFNHEGMADYRSPEIEKFIVDLSNKIRDKSHSKACTLKLKLFRLQINELNTVRFNPLHFPF